jgi:hypothetical protein
MAKTRGNLRERRGVLLCCQARPGALTSVRSPAGAGRCYSAAEQDRHAIAGDFAKELEHKTEAPCRVVVAREKGTRSP